MDRWNTGFIAMNTGTDLVFNIVEQRLTGRIDEVHIEAQAVSGGRAGSKAKGAVNQVLANNPYLTGVKKSDKTPGGAIPMRSFELRTHENRKNWIRLVPLKGENLGGRDGFAIHGRGQRGSDGCIVPTDFHNVLLIYKLVKAREDANKPAPTLAVVAIGDLTRYERLMNMA
ncbi:DUF2778 domain-containing protein [Propylenella binzhouense]|uniref:DUF2778 domain-containing protein n=1 Tax=Propylenella binzhouense TaxID=2555902 RepID=A0A964T8Q4_9HYPH|nr:DUF2778 domain-containing protein [Propylenella binzhouense]MYZ49937.1 hypothetical protein [Propylenella binzhouense]